MAWRSDRKDRGPILAAIAAGMSNFKAALECGCSAWLVAKVRREAGLPPSDARPGKPRKADPVKIKALLALGLSGREVAARLGIGETTVDLWRHRHLPGAAPVPRPVRAVPARGAAMPAGHDPCVVLPAGMGARAALRVLDEVQRGALPGNAARVFRLERAVVEALAAQLGGVAALRGMSPQALERAVMPEGSDGDAAGAAEAEERGDAEAA